MSRHKGKRRAPDAGRQQPAAAPGSDRPVPGDAVPDGWVRLRLAAELLTDAHPGSGSGGGGIDALVARDRRGHPVIWASHIEGVLRDAARRLRGPEIAGNFFGRSGGQQQGAVFTSLYTDSDPGSRIWRSTARASFDNRAPLNDTLRVVEYVPKCARFHGHVELPASDVPLLRRLIQEVDALGRGRSTGAGRVKLALTACTIPDRTVGNSTGRLVLLLHNVDPLCITATSTPDNLIPSLAFIPGRALLGALAGWLIADGHRDAASLFVEGRVSVSDALPVPQVPVRLSDAEVLPAPLALQHEKSAGAEGSGPWWARPAIGTRHVDVRGGEVDRGKLKRPASDLFVYRASRAESWTTFRPERRVRLRNGRPDPRQADPSLFTIEQIVEGTVFLCELRGDQADMAELARTLKPVLQGRRWLRVGRAGAPVEVVCHAWSSTPSPAEVTVSATLTLTSDLLVRDELLRWCMSLDEALLRQLPDWPGDVSVTPIVQESVSVHGFNGTARLWRMPASGIRRGSVFTVEGDGVARLARMAAEGRWLGERTHEGCGRFRLDTTLPGVADAPTSPTSADSSLADDPQDSIAETTRSWFKAHRLLAEPGSSSDRHPSLSQWLDLVADLERDSAVALSSRQHPTTAGGRSWRHPDAVAILGKLKVLQEPGERVEHASMFVRWLRAEMRGRMA